MGGNCRWASLLGQTHWREIQKNRCSQRCVRPFISTASATLIIYQALIQPHFDYCSSVWDGCSAKLSDKMQNLQNGAARIITKSNYDSSATQFLENLHWDELSKRRKKHKAFLICKILNGLAPQYLRNKLNLTCQNLVPTTWKEQYAMMGLPYGFPSLLISVALLHLVNSGAKLTNCFSIRNGLPHGNLVNQ